MEVITTTYSVVTTTLPNGNVAAIGFYYSTGDLVVSGLLFALILVELLWFVYNVSLYVIRMGRGRIGDE